MQIDRYNYQSLQSAAGRVSCNRMALNRCTKTEACWNRNPVSLDSPVLTEILLPISLKRMQAEELKTPRVVFTLAAVTVRSQRMRRRNATQHNAPHYFERCQCVRLRRRAAPQSLFTVNAVRRASTLPTWRSCPQCGSSGMATIFLMGVPATAASYCRHLSHTRRLCQRELLILPTGLRVLFYLWVAFSVLLERCNPWPHVANRHTGISISQLLSL